VQQSFLETALTDIPPPITTHLPRAAQRVTLQPHCDTLMVHCFLAFYSDAHRAGSSWTWRAVLPNVPQQEKTISNRCYTPDEHVAEHSEVAVVDVLNCNQVSVIRRAVNGETYHDARKPKQRKMKQLSVSKWILIVISDLLSQQQPWLYRKWLWIGIWPLGVLQSFSVFYVPSPKKTE